MRRFFHQPVYRTFDDYTLDICIHQLTLVDQKGSPAIAMEKYLAEERDLFGSSSVMKNEKLAECRLA